MDRFFTKEGTWWGGFYELAIELGERSDNRLREALEALWKFRSLEGCFLTNQLEPWEQVKVEPSRWLADIGTADVEHLYGSALLPDGNKVVCGSVIIREDEGIDWLDFYLPVAALEEKYNLDGYPFGNTVEISEEMQRVFTDFDNWLAEIGRAVYASVPFKLALIGNEVSGETYASEIISTGVPEGRWHSYMVPDEEENLNYFPRNIWRPEFTF